jgi:sporulation protein YlmC with PRC-barrel domain
MRSRSLLLSVVIVMLEIVSAGAKPCNQELLDRGAKLPALIVIPAGSPPEEALARALNCSLPPPPTFSGGMEVDPKEVGGHPVFTEGGKHLGYVAGVAVDPNTWRMKSVVLTSDRTGTTNAAVPFDVLALDTKTASIVTEGSNEEDLGKKWPLESHNKFLDNKFLAAFGFCPMCAYPSVVPINITSDPTGGRSSLENNRKGLLSSTQL